MGRVIQIPICQRVGCKVVIKSLAERFYIDLLIGWVYDRIEAKNAKLALPEYVAEIGDTPLIGPYCKKCTDLYLKNVLGTASFADMPSPNR
jgi:hypothetical protein